MSHEDRVRAWNHERGLLDNGFNKELEVRMLQEELDELKEAQTWEDMVDALNDLKVVLTGALWKMNINPIIAFEETLLEIESREGKMVDGKFTKIITGEEYKADYTEAVMK